MIVLQVLKLGIKIINKGIFLVKEVSYINCIKKEKL
jgi:hypothetical protein